MTSRDLTPEDADDPAKSRCLPCQVGICEDCLWLTRPKSCGCACPWLVADVAQHFPSLRGQQ